MVHRAVPEPELDEAVEALVAELASGPTVALGVTKRCINRALDGGLAEAMEAEAMALELSSRSSDFREGLEAFRDRREPRFEGR
jgi:2-(1,2-epoxy-1,2-dihydrophenyl)acetyl-CoA isomerase